MCLKWMWGAVCGKTARTVLRGVYFNCYFKEEVDLLMVHTKYAVKIYEDALREEERKNGRLEMLTDMIVSMLRRKRKPSYIAEELEVTPEMVLSTAKKYNISVVQ